MAGTCVTWMISCFSRTTRPSCASGGRPSLIGSRVFDIAGGHTVAMQNLTIADGAAGGSGGGILNVGVLTLNDVTLSGNTDNDGIDDRLEPAYPQLTVGVDDSALDTDGDGSPDGEELFNMTDLDDADDNFRILASSQPMGVDINSNLVVELTLSTFPGLGYALESGPMLPANFKGISNTDFVATNHNQTIEVHIPPGDSFVRGIRN